MSGLIVRASALSVYVCTDEYKRVYPEGCARFHDLDGCGIHAHPRWRYHPEPRRWWWRSRLTFDEALDKARDYLRRQRLAEGAAEEVNEVERLIEDL